MSVLKFALKLCGSSAGSAANFDRVSSVPRKHGIAGAKTETFRERVDKNVGRSEALDLRKTARRNRAGEGLLAKLLHCLLKSFNICLLLLLLPLFRSCLALSAFEFTPLTRYKEGY